MLPKSPGEIYEVEVLQNIFFHYCEIFTVASVPLSLTTASLNSMVEFQTTNERNGLSITRGFYRVEAISEKRFQIYSPETLNKELNDDEQKLQRPANIAAKLQ